MFNKNSIVIVITLAVSLIFSFTGPITLFAATSPSLGPSSTYGITSSTYTNSLNAGTETTINGDVCYTTPPATAPIAINGATVTPCAPARGTDQSTALTDLNGQACTSLGVGAVTLNTVIIGANPAGTFPPGCYSSGGAMLITLSTTVTLSGAGTYIFRPGGDISTGANSLVTLANGASACDVFWAPIGATTIGANSSTSVTPTFVGNILQNALNAFDVTLGHFVNLSGRVLAFGREVTTDSNTITVPTCVAPQLTVTKTVTNDNGGTKIVSDFPLFLDGGSVTSGAANTISAGLHTVSETTDSDYASTIGGDCAADGTITIASGNVKTCTINNNDIAAHLIVVKHVVNDNGGTAIASDFSTTIAGVSTATPTATGVESPGVNNVLTSVGAYSVDEGAHVGYNKTLSADCSGTIALGETKTCTITNDDIAPQLHLRKLVTLDNGGTATVANFTLTANGAGANDISGTSPVDSGAGLLADTFALSETSPGGYTASPWVCVGGIQVGSNITLGINEDATCTITNDDTATSSGGSSGSRPRIAQSVPATLHVIKQVVNNSGGTATASFFNLHVKLSGTDVAGSPGGGVVVPGRSYTLSPATYVVSEDAGNASYMQSFSGDCDSNGSVTLATGDNKTCTIINDDIAPGVVSPVPGLPATGFPPQEKNTAFPIIILSGISVVSIFLYFARKKQTT